MKRLDIKKLSVLIDSSNDPYVIKISTRVIVNEQEFIEYESVYPLILKGANIDTDIEREKARAFGVCLKNLGTAIELQAIHGEPAEIKGSNGNIIKAF